MAPREHHQPQEEEEEDTAGVVKLISAEGFEFVVDKKAAMVSNTLRNMLTSPGRYPSILHLFRSLVRRPRITSQPPPSSSSPGGFSETRQGEVRFPEIPTNILEKICQYFYWSLHYSSGKETAEFLIEPEITLELMMAANYLDT
ncbi:Elongin [Zea mays]|uniref:Elongin-C n=1 Tax=Zea mays TaxID=4577 RepID=A0A1D6NR85_MAIZE|nr:Elongin [Zea mays]